MQFMKELAVTVAEAARNFSEYLNRAHYQNVTFVLLKNGMPFARLTPEHEKVCFGRDLAKALANVQLHPKEARAWRRDLLAARKKLKAPVDR